VSICDDLRELGLLPEPQHECLFVYKEPDRFGRVKTAAVFYGIARVQTIESWGPNAPLFHHHLYNKAGEFVGVIGPETNWEIKKI